MNAAIPQQIGKPIPRAFKILWTPSRKIEYAYYITFSYSVIAGYLGVEIPLIAAGMTTALAAYCLWNLGLHRLKLFAPIGFLLATAVSVILVQVVVHDVSSMDPQIRAFMLWICGLIIVQSLAVRQGFLQRCTIVLFALGLIAIPHLGSLVDIVERAKATIEIAGGLRNPNGLAVWFGFCLVSFAISGIETKRGTARIVYWLAATGCLFVVGLTVSRGTIFGAALALTVAFRRLLRRGFLPVLLLVILTGVLYVSGIFDQVIANYGERATEESGREHLWPEAIQDISTSPIFGIGFSKAVGPHNSFLYVPLSSGVVPFAFYLAFWIGAAWRSFSDAGQSEYSAFKLPFLLYALVTFILSDLSMEVWSLLTLTVAAGSHVSHSREHLLIAYKTRSNRIPRPLELPSKAETVRQ